MNKILIISGIPFRDDFNLGKTLLTLFSKFAPEELAQLYFSPQTPNVKQCSNYYQINEKQLIQSFFGLYQKRCGREIKAKDIVGQYVVAELNPSSIVALRKFILIPILRDLLWLVSKWNSKKLNSWLDENRPSVIFAVLPGSVRSCKIIEYVAKRCECPVVLFVTDDYYNDPELNPSSLRRWYFRWLQRSIDKMAIHAKNVVGCSELAAREFGEKYHIPYEAFFTPSGAEYVAMPEKQQTEEKPVIFRYFGNLGLERWKPLASLGKAIVDYNQGEQKAILEVYSNLMYPDAIAQLDIPNGCVFKGWVHGEEYMKLLQDADVAVHVESFSEEMCRRTRLSISTKIADYLGAGKCIIAIGRADLASIQHINEVACVVNDISKIEDTVKKLAENVSFRQNLSTKARILAQKQHDINVISLRVKQLLTSNL